MASGGQQSASERAILHILVVGFHHQKGSTVEFVYPPLQLQKEQERDHVTQSLTSTLPAEWRHLPHLALPDGSHNYEKDSVYFTLPSSPTSSSVYGVACCRQIPTLQLHQVETEVTRSTVQKSVCLLSRYPAFNFLQSKLELVTHAYFNMKDFSDVSILHEAYESINSQVTMTSCLHTLHVGLSQRKLVVLLQHRLLQVFKALLLRKRVVVFGSPAEKVGNFVLSIAALFPLSLELHCNRDQLPDKHGLPLGVFEDPSSLQPYVCLQQMESLTNPSSPLPLLAGVVNPLFEKQQKRLCDVFVDVDQGFVNFQDPQTKSQLHLTSADLRFCSLLAETVTEHSGPDEPTTFPGSSEWVKAQFKVYLLSLLATGGNGDTISMNEFGQDFGTVWQRGEVFEAWQKKERGGIMRVDPCHPCEGDISLGDVRRRLVARMSDYGLSVPSGEVVVQETQRMVSEAAGRVSGAVGGAVGGAWAAASTSVYSWWSGTGGKERDR